MFVIYLQNIKFNNEYSLIYSHFLGSSTEGITLYILTRSRDFPEKLTGPQLVTKFPTFYGTRRFIAAFTSARHQCMPSRPIS
jgi:hypothetical protein